MTCILSCLTDTEREREKNSIQLLKHLLKQFLPGHLQIATKCHFLRAWEWILLNLSIMPGIALIIKGFGSYQVIALQSIRH